MEDLHRLSSWRAARAAAESGGWVLAATGDWSWLYRSPEGDQAWRITPFDPAFRAFANVCRTSTNPHLPRILELHDHTNAGYSVIMEWLDPVAKVAADRWFGEFEHAVFLDRELWEHFGSEERVREVLRLLVALGKRSGPQAA